MPKASPNTAINTTPPSIGSPGGGGGIGGGGVSIPCAAHTKLTNKNKIEANFNLFCNLI
ncbi:MAG: hypothetical protein R2816_12500 [Flavobacteriaceae bacterium]|nr:hypothetical protein [Flavobacteriaceae bacterium]